ncbi:sensor histidine kinase [Leifsonia poae]|uniref:sensor histidine kinase n=1 Tax=Leifsonia poae TaxID=110933 RepID=UPI001CBEC123|nr:sensor histidine kinase [Leifsonia poae]
MNHSALTPVFTALRIGLHILVVGLAGFVLARACIEVATTHDWARPAAVIVVSIAFVVSYAAGGPLRSRLIGRWRFVWLALLSVEWLVLAVLTADATFLVFPLFFLFLHLMPLPANVVAVAVATGCAVLLFAAHSGWSVGGVVGPVLGAAVAIAIGLGYRALFREAHERDILIRDLLATREQLAATEREAGTLAERARLAREIHDTVAQGLSSIQLLLHAAERADPGHPAVDTIRLARETAATSLAETRGFIRELTPPALEHKTLAGALRRLGAETERASGVRVTVRESGEPVVLPMTVETALLRIAQGSLANVVQHAHAANADVTLSYMDDTVTLDVVDDGGGFDTDAIGSGERHPDSFGLRAIRERAEALGGEAVVEARLGRGTAVAVSIPLATTANG